MPTQAEIDYKKELLLRAQRNRNALANTPVPAASPYEWKPANLNQNSALLPQNPNALPPIGFSGLVPDSVKALGELPSAIAQMWGNTPKLISETRGSAPVPTPRSNTPEFGNGGPAPSSWPTYAPKPTLPKAAGPQYDPTPSLGGSPVLDAATEATRMMDAANAANPPLTRNYPEFGTTIDFPPDTTAAEIAQVEAQMNARAAQQQKMQALQGIGGMINEAMNYQPQYATIDKAAAAGMTPQAMQNTLKTQQGVIDEGMAQRHQMEVLQLQQQQRQREMEAMRVNKNVDRVLTLSQARLARQEAVQRARELNAYHAEQLGLRQQAELRASQPEFIPSLGGTYNPASREFTPVKPAQDAIKDQFDREMQLRTANQPEAVNYNWEASDGTIYESNGKTEKITFKNGKTMNLPFGGYDKMQTQKQDKWDKMYSDKRAELEHGEAVAETEKILGKRPVDPWDEMKEADPVSAPSQVDVSARKPGDTWEDATATYTLGADGKVYGKRK